MGNRNNYFTVRLTEYEYQNLKLYASFLGCSTSAYIRHLIAIKLVEGDPGPDVSHTDLVVAKKLVFFQILRQLNAWRHLYNQIVDAMDVIGGKRFLFEEDLCELCAEANKHLQEIERIRTKVTSAVTATLEDFTTPKIWIQSRYKNFRVKKVNVRLSESEGDTLAANAEFLGCNRSDYLRALIAIPCRVLFCENDARFVEYLAVDVETLPSIVANARSLGYCLNKAAHTFNMIKAKNSMPEERAFNLFSTAVEAISEFEAFRAPIEYATMRFLTSRIMNLDERYRW